MKHTFVINIIINPVVSYLCFTVAFIFCRKKGVTIQEALFFPLRRAALDYGHPFAKDIFTTKGIFLLITGLLIALLDVVLY